MKCYIDLGQKEKVIHHASLADQALGRFFELSAYQGLQLDQAKIKQQLGIFFQENGNLEDALLQYQAAEKIYLEVFPTAKNREMARTYSAHAQLFADQENWTKALKYHQLALSAIIGNFSNENWLENPSLGQIRAERVIAEVLLAKAATLRKRYIHNGDKGDLELALECHELIYQVERLIRQTYLYEQSKLGQIAKRQQATEMAIDIAYTLWESNSKERKYMDLGLQFVERNKSILLLEAFQRAHSRQTSTSSSNLIAEDYAKRKSMADLEKAIFAAQSNLAPDSTILELQDQLLDNKQSYRSWASELALDAPNYFNINHQNLVSSVEELQSLLNPEQTLLEYFVGEKHIYIFSVSRTEVHWTRVLKDFPLESWVQAFRSSIEDFQLPGKDKLTACSTFSETGHQLYKAIFEPVQKTHALTKEILIIPSGILSFLPFEALLTQESSNCKFAAYPYLLLDHQIQYTLSCSLQKLSKEKVRLGSSYFGLAPEFDEHSNFGALYKNIESVQTSKEIFGGQIFPRDQATISQFLALAPKHQIIHLSTHAKANMDSGDFSYIVFADGNGGYDSLYTRDIYLLALEAELVILSACETGIGQLLQGEGIISLARGFLYAGANSVLTSLWQINDETNHHLTNSFYKQLKKGKSKSKALRLAKLDYLKEADNISAHPVYWAAFVGIGNDRALATNHYWLYIGSVTLVLLIMWILYSRNRGNVQKVHSNTSIKNKLSPIEN